MSGLKLIKNIKIPKNTKVSLNSNKNSLHFEGSQSKLSLNIIPEIKIEINTDCITLKVIKDDKNLKKFLFLYSSLINKSLKGVSQKFKVHLILKGIGFKVNQEGKFLNFKLGFSHDISLKIPNNIETKIIDSNQIILYSSNWSELTQFSHIIKKLKKVEPYKGKGILLKNETILRKEGKKNKK